MNELLRTDGDAVVMKAVLTAGLALRQTLSVNHFQETDGTQLLLFLLIPDKADEYNDHIPASNLYTNCYCIGEEGQ